MTTDLISECKFSFSCLLFARYMSWLRSLERNSLDVAVTVGRIQLYPLSELEAEDMVGSVGGERLRGGGCVKVPSL